MDLDTACHERANPGVPDPAARCVRSGSNGTGVPGRGAGDAATVVWFTVHVISRNRRFSYGYRIPVPVVGLQ